jgi:signal transduction histidine kinase
MRPHAPTLVLESAPDISAVVDPDRLAQAIRNLVNNAIAHAPGDGAITVRAYERPGGALRFEVDDEGSGVPVEARAAIFDRFHRLEGARDRGVGGAGLGLSIVQAIAEAHGGRAEVGETPAGGARFSIEVPLSG